MNTSLGVIVGRFQVDALHAGHKELINTVQKVHSRIAIFLGVAPGVNTKRNPLDFAARRRMIHNSYPNIEVLQLPDNQSDVDWSRELDERIREVAPIGSITLYGGRDSFVPHYVGTHKPIELKIVATSSGSEIRQRIANTVLNSVDFRTGVIHAAHNRYPAAIPCVDIAILDVQEGIKVLLAQKPGEEAWRFVGGHVSPEDSSLEMAAKREASEETGLELERVEYIGSHRIDDWRWKTEENKIITAFFAGYNSMGVARAADDISAAKWFDIKFIHYPSDIVKAHQPLFVQLLSYLGLEKNVKPDSANGLIQADALEAVPA